MLFFISPEHLEAFQNCLNRRYVDMLFFISPENLEAFQNCLNGRHANMSFAIGNEKQSRMSFLDVQVIREDKTFTKCIYRTFSGVYKHIYSFLTSAYMFGTAYLLAYRCFKICSCWTKLHTELSSLKQYFLKKNGYPENFTSNCFERFTDNYSNSSKEVHNLVQYLYKLGLN